MLADRQGACDREVAAPRSLSQAPARLTDVDVTKALRSQEHGMTTLDNGRVDDADVAPLTRADNVSPSRR